MAAAHAQGKSYPCQRHLLKQPSATLLSPKLCGRPEQGKISAAWPRCDSRLIGHADLACWPSGGHVAIQTYQSKERTGFNHSSTPTLEELPRSLMVISNAPTRASTPLRRSPSVASAHWRGNAGGTTGPITRRYYTPRRCAIAAFPIT